MTQASLGLVGLRSREALDKGCPQAPFSALQNLILTKVVKHPLPGGSRGAKVWAPLFLEEPI